MDKPTCYLLGIILIILCMISIVMDNLYLTIISFIAAILLLLIGDVTPD